MHSDQIQSDEIPPIKAKLYQHQNEAYHKAIKQDSFALLFDMGLGKSLTTLAIMGRRFLRGEVRRAMVVCPKSVCTVWREELAKFADYDYMTCVIEGSKKNKIKQFEAMKGEWTEDLKIIIINYETLWRVMDEVTDFSPDMVVCDESHRIKNPDAKQSTSLHQLGDLVRYKMILTGTPVQNSPLDFFSQYRFLKPEVFGWNYKTFKYHYTISGGYKNYEIIGYRYMDELVRKVHNEGLRVAKEDALDLPDQIFTKRYGTMTDAQARLYKEIARKVIGQVIDPAKQSATILTRLLKLQQLAGGFIETEAYGTKELVSSQKLILLEESIEEQVERGGKKVVIFARFIHELEAIGKVLRQKGITYRTLSGRTKDRGQVIQDFQEDEKVRVMVAQIQTAGVGITLTAAEVAIYYSATYSYADYAQSLARIHRIGQTKPCTYIFLIMEGTIDEMIYKTLEKKQDLATLLVDEWQSLVLQAEKRKERMTLWKCSKK